MSKFYQLFTRFRISACVFALTLTAAIAGPVPPDKPAAYPDWWFTQDVIPRLDPANATPYYLVPGTYPVADDYAVANIGQLKYIAIAADTAMDASLSGGSGAVIDVLIGPWKITPAPPGSPPRDDFAALNLGQLKYVAKPFYDRLGLTPYPWTGTGADDYALANLGQLKRVFSFTISSGPTDPNDSDTDGLLDSWELSQFGNLAQTASGNPDSDALTNLAEMNVGSNPTITETTAPPVDLSLIVFSP